MGFTYARIELVNVDDQALVRRKLLPESKVRKTQVKALADCGADSTRRQPLRPGMNDGARSQSVMTFQIASGRAWILTAAETRPRDSLV